MMIKKWIIVFLIFLSTSGIVHAYAKPKETPRQGLKAIISLPKGEVTIKDLHIILELENISKETIEVDPWIGNWFVQVYDEQVNIINPKFRAVDVLRPYPQIYPLKPGEKKEFELS